MFVSETIVYSYIEPDTNSAPIECESTCGPPTAVLSSHLSIPVILQNIVGLLNFIVQIAAIKFIYTGKKFQRNAFFVLLICLSTSVIVRTLFSVFSLFVSSFLDMHSFLLTLLTRSSLYLDYFSYFFSILLIFLMSLNRCLLFVSHDWNHKIFHKFRLIVPISLSILLSLSAAVTVVLLSEIQRSFFDYFGFVDMGKPSILRNLINRLSYLFPIGSVVCYLVLFYHLRRKTQSLPVSTQHNQGESKVFVQILITAVFYGIMSLLQELLALLSVHVDPSFQRSLISFLNIFSYLPEMSLPLLLLCSNAQLRSRISKWIAPSQASSIVVPVQNTISSMR